MPMSEGRRVARMTGDRRPASATPAKLAEIVARQIEDDIVARGWPVGSVLGSEAELVERYGVSRAVLREAVRIVEHHFVATMRRGPGGGLVVTAPNLDAIVRAVTLQLEYERIDPLQVHEARTVLEITSLRLAAERLTTDDVNKLKQELVFDRSAPARPQNFHVWIAQFSGNPALALFVSVLTMLMHDSLRAPRSRAVTAELNQAHRAISEALIAGDAEVAEQLMLQHLERVKTWIRPSSRKPGRGAGNND
jgi:DNA-binding FadR family transcriptional regulator